MCDVLSVRTYRTIISIVVWDLFPHENIWYKVTKALLTSFTYDSISDIYRMGVCVCVCENE